MSDSSAGGAQSQNNRQQSVNGRQSQTAAGSDAESLLKADHRKVEQLFQQYEDEEDDEAKGELAGQVCRELVVHTMLEEELFYPALRRKGVEDDLLDEAQVEHDGAKVLIADLMQGEPQDEFYDAKVKTLSEYIKHHVGEEERPGTGIFAKAHEAGVDMEGLGKRIQARKIELMSRIDEISSRPPKPRALHVNLQSQENRRMPRYSNDRPRDEEGRFMSDDDRGRFSRYSRSRYDDDDDDRRGSRGGRGGSGQGGWFGDAQGHSEASREGWEHRGSSRSSRSRYDDDDDYRSSGRGHGGWSGDAQGHSEASREGWEHRGSSRSSRSRYDDDDDSRGSRGRGHGGWYGDPEGHSEASREGWEHRGSSRSSRSRYDDDDDDRRGSRGGRGHGGWFGDSEGHSQASREGWDRR